MKKLIITSSVILIFSLTSLSQVSHLIRIYDFEGNDFDGLGADIQTNPLTFSRRHKSDFPLKEVASHRNEV